MPRAYATFVVGEKDVVIYDETLKRIEAKTVIVSQAATEAYNKEKKKHVLDLGKMIIKADGRLYDCIEFKKFNNGADRDSWITEKSKATP